MCQTRFRPIGNFSYKGCLTPESCLVTFMRLEFPFQVCLSQAWGKCVAHLPLFEVLACYKAVATHTFG